MKKHQSPTTTLLVLSLWWFFGVIAIVMAQRNNGGTTLPTRVVKVGAVLDVGGAMVGKMGLNSIRMCIHDFYVSHPHYKTRLQLILRDSQGDIVTAAAAQAVDLIKNEQVVAVIGAITTMEAMFVINLEDKVHVPILTLSEMSPSLSSLHTPYLFQISQKDYYLTQVEAITAIVQAFGWKQVVPIYVDNDYGQGVIASITNSFQKAYIRVPYLSAIDFAAANDAIERELYKLMTMQTRVFVVHMTPSLASRLFVIAKVIGMMDEGYVWIVTAGIANLFNSLDPSVIKSMEGVLGVRPYIPRTKQLLDFSARWKREFLRDNPTLVHVNLDVSGIWAYDATAALAMAVEKLDNTLSGFTNVSNNSSNVTDPENFGVLRNGEKLRKVLSNVKFKGVSGEFKVVGSGKLEASSFEIVNVIGNSERNIGFWTSQKGLIRNMDAKNSETIDYSNSKENLRTIIWPGDSYSVPKGWEMPTYGNKLKIGVPVKDNGFSEFVKVIHDPTTNSTKVTGFCIDVFNAAVEALPYALPFEFIPFERSNDEMAGTYDDLITQVYYGKFDAVVGDTTITGNRSKYVDFTLSYTESGVTMVVLVRDNKKNAWAFLKPLTWELWVTIFFIFVFIGFVVWVLEHRINDNFRGPVLSQIHSSLWFSFSTMSFSPQERVMSCCGKFVVIVWIFVVQILVQSYSASLTALLTVEQLRPAIMDVQQLLKNRLNVGYLEGSIVHEILKDLGFHENQLKIYKSVEECNDLFTKGSANGGIDAAFDEIPYVRHLLGTYCSKYAMVEPRFKTGGFGFVFPKGSPIAGDISRAILNVSEGGKMTRIENAWLNGCSYQDSNNNAAQVSSSTSLGLESFRGLFLVVGVCCLLALVIFFATFLCRHRHILSNHNHSNNSSSIITCFRKLLTAFDARDLGVTSNRRSAPASRPSYPSPVGPDTPNTQPEPSQKPLATTGTRPLTVRRSL